MIRLSRNSILFVILAIITFAANAQTNLPFAADIAAFKKQDSISKPAAHEILFVGSSSFTKWTDVQSYFPSYPIINRGFGGSTLLDVIAYANDVIFPYNPKQIFIYCGENDLAFSDTVSAQTVMNRFVILFDMIRRVYKDVPIDFVSLKPSPSRENLIPKMMAANMLIKNYLANKPNTEFIDVYSKMFTADGKMMPEIYIEDKLHMNAKGYAIWQKIIEPYLVK